MLASCAFYQKSLRADYEKGYLKTTTEIIHGDVFADFLESAKYLLDRSYKDAAEVIAGGVLEDQLRKLSIKNGRTA